MRTEELVSVADNVPKVFDARGHAVMDYVTAAGFLTMAFAMRERHPRAAGLAFVHGAGVLLASLMTDYPGGLWRTISFRTHGALDVMQAGMLAIGPTLLGFAGDPEAQAFHGQALLEGGIVAATDWAAA